MKKEIYVFVFAFLLFFITGCETTNQCSVEANRYLIKGDKSTGKYEGYVKIYSTPINLLAEGEAKNGEPIGKWTYWHSQGPKLAEIEHFEGQRNGLIKMWYTSYHLSEQRNVIKLIGTQKMDNWDGEVKNYYPNGQLKLLRIYSGGRLIMAEGYTSSGDLTADTESNNTALSLHGADDDYFAILKETVVNSFLYAKPIEK